MRKLSTFSKYGEKKSHLLIDLKKKRNQQGEFSQEYYRHHREQEEICLLLDVSYVQGKLFLTTQGKL